MEQLIKINDWTEIREGDIAIYKKDLIQSKVLKAEFTNNTDDFFVDIIGKYKSMPIETLNFNYSIDLDYYFLDFYKIVDNEDIIKRHYQREYRNKINSSK